MTRYDNGAYSRIHSMGANMKHCVPQRIAAAAAMRMRRHRRQRQRQTRHYDMILWLYNLVVDVC